MSNNIYRNVSASLKLKILKRDNYTCRFCNRNPISHKDVALQIDHIYPHYLGGSDNEKNLQVLCQECNLEKSNKLTIVTPQQVHKLGVFDHAVKDLSIFSWCVGRQRELLFYIAKKVWESDDEHTAPMTMSITTKETNITPKTIKQTIYRLVKKGYITRVHSKTGRGGWAIYSLSDECKRIIVNYIDNFDNVGASQNHKNKTSLQANNNLHGEL